jgi:pimeloyl-ACP methyl ester carboxylesterase
LAARREPPFACRQFGRYGMAANSPRAGNFVISDKLAESSLDNVPTTMRRRVFFIAGFDPRGVKGYYQRLSESLGPMASVGQLERQGAYGALWRWRSPAAETTFEFLQWDDIVDRHWRAKGRIGAQVAAARALWVYHRCGLLAHARDGARAVRWALLVMGLAPLALAVATIAFPFAVGALGARAIPYGGWLAAPALIVALLVGDLAWRKLNLEWLAKGFACIVETAKGEAPSWDARCAVFAARIAEVERGDVADEIVVVGHSLGAILATMTLSRYLALGERPRRRIAFATLGNIIPFYTWIEPGRRTMREGEEVARSPFVEWIDVTSGSDPASACRMGPLFGADAQVARWEPEFHRILTPERFRHIRRRPLDFHFQYLKRSDCDDGFDLVRMMCSPQPFFAEAPR